MLHIGLLHYRNVTAVVGDVFALRIGFLHPGEGLFLHFYRLAIRSQYLVGDHHTRQGVFHTHHAFFEVFHRSFAIAQARQFAVVLRRAFRSGDLDLATGKFFERSVDAHHILRAVENEIEFLGSDAHPVDTGGQPFGKSEFEVSVAFDGRIVYDVTGRIDAVLVQVDGHVGGIADVATNHGSFGGGFTTRKADGQNESQKEI